MSRPLAAWAEPPAWSNLVWSAWSPGPQRLHRYLSNDAIPEEEPSFPLAYRGHPSLRGVDHIRGSRCLLTADLHSSATMPYQEAASRRSAGSSAAPPAAPPPSTKQPGSLLGGWLARLRLLSH